MLHIKTHPVIHLTESDAEDVSAYYDLICHRIRQAEHRYQNGEVCSLINAFLLRVVGIMDCRLDFTETGRTPTDVIKVVTMKEIERRLRYSTDSIKQISAALNFPNTSFFGKYFKQHSGMTPNSYRKKYHK